MNAIRGYFSSADFTSHVLVYKLSTTNRLDFIPLYMEYHKEIKQESGFALAIVSNDLIAFKPPCPQPSASVSYLDNTTVSITSIWKYFGDQLILAYAVWLFQFNGLLHDSS